MLVVESADAFDEKVGEATTEMSAMFLTRRLAHVAAPRARAAAEGGRCATGSTTTQVTGHADASETGGYLRSTVPSFQLRRDALDEHLLATAVAEGAELLAAGDGRAR